ncbi:hypothetical protein KW868_02920 [Acinetobacter guillouiae]|uniref:Uncharacterized protein n=1 Tax=Acinetobacter guillouiae TaxID=106649 RepID=A0A8X8KC54_ACIGI|nr:hypothetical protein [Acinetobacter guillouiae]MCF0263424.1 hypothetical protein [Acinetobacter guillouiae]
MFGFLRGFIGLLYFLKKEDQKITLDELANIMSNHTDQIIIDLMQKESLNFGGGFFEIFYDDEKPKKFDIYLKLYFLNINGDILMKETKKMLTIGCLCEKDCIELRSYKTIKYEVNPPIKSIETQNDQ